VNGNPTSVEKLFSPSRFTEGKHNLPSKDERPSRKASLFTPFFDTKGLNHLAHLQFCPQRLHLQVVLPQQALGLRLQFMAGGMQRRRLTKSCADTKPRLQMRTGATWRNIGASKVVNKRMKASFFSSLYTKKKRQKSLAFILHYGEKRKKKNLLDNKVDQNWYFLGVFFYKNKHHVSVHRANR